MVWELSTIVSTIPFSAAPNCLCCKASDIPMTPFSGVRISWLIVARNSDFASLAVTASRRASFSETSRFTRSVTS